MKRNHMKYLSALLAALFALSLFTAASVTAAEEGAEFEITEQPVSANYLLEAAAEPLGATFERIYDNTALHLETPIILRWYWSYVDSNAGRVNVLEEVTVGFEQNLICSTNYTPATDAIGVMYYYAVLSYAVYDRTAQTHEVIVDKVAVTATARIEVTAPDEPRPSQNIPVNEPEPTMRVTVNKTDADGEPLAGAEIRLAGLSDRVVPRVYSVVTNSRGEAVFSAEYGVYVLSEYSAPAGYNATDETYNIVITANGVYINAENEFRAYETVTFVNHKIPELNTEDHFAYMKGYPDGTFKPGSNMTRAEAVVMFSRLLGETMDLTIDYRFDCYPDVDYLNPSMDEPWYANQVCYMRSLGVLKDYSRDERFRPNDPVTRAEFATLASHFDNLVPTDTNNFSDVSDDHWAVKYINSAAAKGWIVGYGNGTFEPDSLINRAEVVTLVNRILNRKGDGAYLEARAGSLPRTYSDLTGNHWAYLDIMEASLGHDYTRDGAGERWTAVYP